MRVEYDKAADAAYVYFKGKIRPGEVMKTITLNDSIIVDLDADDRLLGLEILEASENLAKQSLAQICKAGKPQLTAV